MKELRCKHCNKKLMDLDFGKGEIKCDRCGKIVSFNIITQSYELIIDKLKERTTAVLTEKQ